MKDFNKKLHAKTLFINSTKNNEIIALIQVSTYIVV